MMKKKMVLGALIVAAVSAFAAKDPVLMTINGKDVTLSEFEYLYHKNSSQQLQQESLDDYIDRFVVYKLKVADGEAAGYDTLSTFRKELEGYRSEIVSPYLTDSVLYHQLEREAYEHMLKRVRVSHIMFASGNGEIDGLRQMHLADSVRTAILNGADFGELALKYSIDRGVQRNHGDQGYLRPGRFPITFECAGYNTPVGEISKPFRTDFGIHIVKTSEERAGKGTVLVEHILRMFADQSDSAKVVAKKEIDDIAARLKAGENFETIAKEQSQDPGSAKNGGKLPWFGQGEMVEPFEVASYALGVGEVSEPVETRYGYHIIKKLDERPIPSFEESLPKIREKINFDERSTYPRKSKIEQLKKEYNFTVNPEFMSYVDQTLKAFGKYDSTYVDALIAPKEMTAFSYADVNVPASRLATRLTRKESASPELAKEYINNVIEEFGGEDLMRYYTGTLIERNPDFSNLLNEYRDGMLLFEASNHKVWDGASKDTEGLEKYFESHRSDFTWDAPHFRGVILKAKNDSVMNEVQKDIALYGADSDSISTTLFQKYRNNIKMERMLVAKGENNVVDYLLFGAAKPEKIDGKYSEATVLQGKVLEQPEKMTDVKGQVTTAYQDELERQWVEELKAKYPVVIDKKVKKKVK